MPTEECTGTSGGWEKSSRQKNQMIDDIKIYVSYAETKRKTENIGKIGECWFSSDRPALGQRNMYE